MNWRAACVALPTPARNRAGVRRLARRALVFALSVSPMALVIFNLAVLGAVLVVLLRVVHTLRQAVCVIGGETLIQCMGGK